MQKIKNNLPLLLAFIIPFFVMLLVFIQRGIFPFGERSFLRTDLYHQYAPFYQEMADKLKNGESLLFSWDIGNGSNFLALYAYYLSSPINWLLVIFPQKYVIEFITYLIVLKISLSGSTMAYYLKKHTGKNNYALAMFGSFYALSGYMAAYSWNIMWLDCILIFPLIMLGLEKLVKEDKCMLYCLTLAFAILSNYYIAIMICITMVMYFLALLIIEPAKRSVQMTDEESGLPIIRTYYMNYPKKIVEFAVYSLIAGGLAAILLLPATYALQMSASANSTFPKTFTTYFSILEMLARHLDNVPIHLGLDHWPNIFCGAAILMFIPLYVLNRRVNYREKATYFAMILFLLASFSMNFLNFIWHGFHYPNSLPCRQSFVYVFLLLTMGYKGFLGLKERSTKQIVASMWGAIAFILLCEHLISEDDWNFKIYYVSILFVALYGLLAYLYRRNPKTSPFLVAVAFLAVFGENFMNTTITSVTTISRPNYVEYDEDYAALIEQAEQLTDTTFYRMEKLRLRTKNDGSWYQYPSISVFSSTANAAMSSYYKKLGMESATNAYSKTGATYLIDMLFSVKYEFSNVTYSDNGLRKMASSSGSVKMYENLYTLPLGFMVPSDMEDLWYSGGSNPIDTQNNFISAATGELNLFKYVNVPESASDTSSSYTVTEPGYYYAFILNSSIDNATTSITRTDGSSSSSTNHSSLKRRFVVDIGYANEGDTINISTSDENQSLFFSLYVLQEDVLKRAFEALNDEGLIVNSYTDTQINASIDVLEDGLLYTSIAYDKGWTVQVDGTEVEPVNFKEAMLAIPLSAGHHEIVMTYMPQGFILGIYLTLGSLLLLIVITAGRALFRKYVHLPSAFIDDEFLPIPSASNTEIKEAEEDESPEASAVESSVPEPDETEASEPEASPVPDAAEKTVAKPKVSRKKNRK